MVDEAVAVVGDDEDRPTPTTAVAMGKIGELHRAEETADGEERHPPSSLSMTRRTAAAYGVCFHPPAQWDSFVTPTTSTTPATSGPGAEGPCRWSAC